MVCAGTEKHSYSNQNCTDRFVCMAKQQDISNTLTLEQAMKVQGVEV